MKRSLAPVLAVVLAGCYSTTKVDGDATSDSGTDPGHDSHTDPHVDPAVDPHVDPSVDPAMDPGYDPIYDPPYDVPSDCPAPSPAPDGPYVSFSIDGDDWPWDYISIDEMCDIVDVFREDEGAYEIFLACRDSSTGEATEHVITIWVYPDMWMPVYPGDMVRFEYIADPIWWVNRYFRLSYPEGVSWTIVAGFDGDEPNPPIWGNFYPPLMLTQVHGGCPLEWEECYDSERMAIQVTYDDMTTLVYDSQLAWIGPWGDYAVYVDKAEEHSNWRCTDVPGAWYTGLIVPSGWD